MGTFGTSKILAGIGSLLYGTIIGIILVLIGMKDLSEHYKDKRIYDGLVKGVILLIVGTILPIAGGITLFFSILGTSLNSSYSSGYYGGYDSYGTNAIAAGVIGLVAVVIICFIIAFILDLLAVRYIKNCFHALAERSNNNLFHTAATLIWVGAILAIIGIGFFLIWIGFIIAAIGFFTLDEKTVGTGNTSATPPPGYTQPYSYTTQQQPNTQPTTTAGAKANFCPNCGAAVKPNATFCANCGKQIQ
ncbi:DUF996 domain-containing protein [Candidatus Bathycorpusculum sp.]|jgi:uncharacterized membrane protein|uniref:DUF996 domain-containing protein n=1 Tax=Candidatus Bathycorpusculum sp. TaxID=2994959 RepID=UPI00282D9035|nr:DUF996 domain-containing protein [Candidatus Termitimicrobium sp.]MCL2686303.1 DUF996 domain-containing protein [Candidatus Termitimicrobium sp.]